MLTLTPCFIVTRLQPLIDIGLSRAFDVTWKAMEDLVERRKVKYIGEYITMFLSKSCNY